MAVVRYGPRMIGSPGILGVRPMLFEFVGDKVEGDLHDFDHATVVMVGGLHIIEEKYAIPGDLKSKYFVREYDVDAPGQTFINALLKGEMNALQDAISAHTAFGSCFPVIYADTVHTLIARYNNTVAGCLYPWRNPDTKNIAARDTGWIGSMS